MRTTLGLSHKHAHPWSLDCRPPTSPQGQALLAQLFAAGFVRLPGAPWQGEGLAGTDHSSLLRLAARGDSAGLRAWVQAGADLGQPGYDGRSALQVVSAPCPTPILHPQGCFPRRGPWKLSLDLWGGDSETASMPAPPQARAAGNWELLAFLQGPESTVQAQSPDTVSPARQA